MPFSVRLDNYPDRLEKSFETADENLRVLYMGNEKDSHTETLEQILEERYEGGPAEIHYLNIDRDALERSSEAEKIQGDAARLPYQDDSFDLVVTNHLRCNPESKAELAENETLDQLIEEEERRVSRQAGHIDEAC